LFVSDLDGTLLGEGAVFPCGLDLVNRINGLVGDGVKLTYATARTIQSVKDILRGITFPAPVALMNGVVIRDMNRGEYLNAEYLGEAAVLSLLAEMKARGLSPFVYALHDGVLSTSYAGVLNPFMKEFRDRRIEKYNKPFREVDKIEDAVSGDRSVIYVVMMDTYERLLEIYRLIEQNPLLACAFYKDSYAPGVYYLEIFSKKASKGAAIRHLKAMTGAEQVVVFGDNTNDLPMFAESDFSCATGNASDEVKAAADLVIGSAEEGGVIDFLEKLVKNR